MIRNLYLFDLDGTLVDTAPDLSAAANRLRTARGLPALPLESLRAASGKGSPALVLAALGIPKDDPRYPPLKAEFLSYYSEMPAARSALFPGIAAMLASLRKQGCRIGVVTNKPFALAERVLRALSLADEIQVLIGCDSPGAALKPRPDSLLTALKRFDALPDEAVYVGDSASDCTAAHAAGLPCALVRWGYMPEPPESATPDFIASVPSDLLTWRPA